jgi:hypothetical protein
MYERGCPDDYCAERASRRIVDNSRDDDYDNIHIDYHSAGDLIE